MWDTDSKRCVQARPAAPSRTHSSRRSLPARSLPPQLTWWMRQLRAASTGWPAADFQGLVRRSAYEALCSAAPWVPPGFEGTAVKNFLPRRPHPAQHPVSNCSLRVNPCHLVAQTGAPQCEQRMFPGPSRRSQASDRDLAPSPFCERILRATLIRCGRQVMEDHSRPVLSLAWSATHLFSGSYDNTIRVWDLTTLRKVQVLQGASTGLAALLPSPFLGAAHPRPPRPLLLRRTQAFGICTT